MRRLCSIIAGVLLASMTVAPAVLAEDEPGIATEHPLVGSWLIQDVGLAEPPDILMVAPGGILAEAGPEGTGYGSWAPAGGQEAELTFLLGLQDPDAGFVGYSVFRAAVEVASDGQSLSGTYTVEPPAELAAAFGIEAGQLGPGEITGQRIVVEPMGDPVATIPAPDEVLPEE
jgi:hypothetical protein